MYFLCNNLSSVFKTFVAIANASLHFTLATYEKIE